MTTLTAKVSSEKVHAPINQEVKPKHAQWEGRKITVNSHWVPANILRVAMLAIIAAGITLLAVLTGGAAIAGGVSLIVTGVFGFTYSIVRPTSRENEFRLKILSKISGLQSFDNLPRAPWQQTKDSVFVSLRAKNVSAVGDSPMVFIGEDGEHRSSTFAVTVKKENEKILLDTIVFDKALNDKKFVIESDKTETLLVDIHHQISFWGDLAVQA